MDYQRKHPRFLINTPAAVEVLGHEDAAISAKVDDISEGGFKLMLPVPVAIGETLRVEILGDVFVGVVRNINPAAESEMVVGLELIHWIQRGKLDELLEEWTVAAF